jgi:uncharacterized protein GlcG (DUF336 family)
MNSARKGQSQRERLVRLDRRLQCLMHRGFRWSHCRKQRKIIGAAEKKAIEINQPMNIAVVDEGGNLVSHVRMDGAWIGSIDIAINKAFTSRAFDISTKDLAQHSQSGGQFFGIHASNHGRVMVFAGGIPLKREGKIVGAIGVSGGSGEQDHAVAEAGAKAF